MKARSCFRLSPARSSCRRFVRKTIAQGFALLTHGLLLCALLSLVVLPPHAMALPAGGQVIAGQVAATLNGAQLTLDQASRAAIMNWQSFNIGANEIVRILQPGADAAMLARVTGGSPTELLGRLQADGKLFLVNPRGILVGQGAVIDTAAFLASTLDVADADFLKNGPLTFKGDSTAGVVNLGKITAHEGSVLLLAHTVKNAGEIAAPNGAAGLGAGTEVWLASPDDSAFVIKFNAPSSAKASEDKSEGTAVQTGVENSGVITAVQAQLEAAGGSLYEMAINQSGIIRAQGVERRPDGRVLLTAGGGNVAVTGTVSARDADGSGGEIFVGGDYRGANPGVANAARTYVGPDALIDASASDAEGAAISNFKFEISNSRPASGGRVIVWAEDATRFLGTLEARGSAAGGDGGFAEISGKRFLDFRPAAAVDLTAPAGATGTLLLDPSSLYVGTVDPGDADSFMDAATLAAQLNSTNVTLDTSGSHGDITFDAALTWTSDHTLRVNSSNGILFTENADLTGGAASRLELYSGLRGIDFGEQGDEIRGRIEQDEGSTLAVGTLTIGANPVPAAILDAPGEPDDPLSSGTAVFDGILQVDTLEIDLALRVGMLIAANPSNEIGTLATTGGGGTIGSINVEDGAGGLDVKLTLPEDSDTFFVRAVTPGALTLLGGSRISTLNEIDVYLASSGGAFINQAGADVFGDNVRFLIYANSPHITTKGDLVGNDIFNHPYVPFEDFSGDRESRFLFAFDASLPVLTYTADNKSRTYGADDPPFTATVAGLLGGDVLGDVVTGAPAFSTTATQSSGVGATYTIDISLGTLLSSQYAFAFVPGTLTIAAAPLTITAHHAIRTVGSANPPFGVTYSGFVLGHDASVVSGLQLGTSAGPGSPAGDYPITPSGATAPNYTITFMPGLLTVTDSAPLTITANDFSRLYGAANPSFTAAIAGLIGVDTEDVVTGLQFSTTATMNSGVGAYAITPFGAEAPGYVISFLPGTLTITPAPLTISAQPVSRTYGDPNPALTPTFSGLVAGDTSAVVTGLSVGTAATPASGAGLYPITVAGGSAANYTLTRNDSTLQITPAHLVVRADDKTRPYGDPEPALTVTATGLRNGDALENSVFFTLGPATLASANSPVGTYPILFDGASRSPNYTAAFQGGTLAIMPRPLTIAADDQTKVYGDPNPAFTATFTGLASFDTPAAITGLSLTTPATESSGVSTFGIFVTSNPNPNYAIGYQFEQLQITPAPLTMLPLEELTRIYGRANPVPTLPTVGGLKLDDTPQNLGLQYLFPEPTAGAGTHTYSLTITNPNYTLTHGPGEFRVEPAPLTVQLGGGGRHYGDPNPAGYGTRVQGVVLGFGDTADSVLRIDNPADPTVPVGTYQLAPALLSSNYYFADVSEGAFVVNPRLLNVDIDSIARYFGDPTPDFSWTLGGDGLAPHDNAAAVFLGVQPAVPVTPATDVGVYRIDPVYAANPNYVVSWWPGWLAILPRPIEVVVNNGISFGNNNVPANFDAVAEGVSLVGFGGGHPAGTGFGATITGLPTFVSQQDFLANVVFQLSNTNDPSPIGTAVNPADYPFPTRPAAPTPPQAPSAPLPPTLPDPQVVVFTPGVITPAEAPPVTTPVFVLDDTSTLTISGTLVLDYHAPATDTAADRFADVIRFIVPQGYGTGNYVVTKVTNGVLTMKADPVVVQRTLEHEAALAKRRADEAAFLMTTPHAPGEVRLATPVAFGLTRELIPSIRAALGLALVNELTGGDLNDENSLARMINGGATLDNFEQLTEDKILAWLADIHTNPTKQALLMPALMAHTMNLATRDPARRSDQEAALVAHITPALGGARDQFIENAEQARLDWVATEGEARGTQLGGLIDGKVPYATIIGNAVGATMADAMQAYERKAEQATDATGLNLAAGGVSGGVAGITTAVAMNSANVFKSIFPHAAQAMKRAAAKAGETAIKVVVAKGVSKAAASAAGTVGSIISLAVTILVSEACAIADEREAQARFEAMLSSGKDPIDPHAMMKSETGRSIMMLGLANLFLGGGNG